MAYVEYTGEVIKDEQKKDPFEKDAGGFKLSSIEDIDKQINSNWWHLPTAVAVGAGAATAAGKVYEYLQKKKLPPQERIDPTFEEPIQPAEPKPQTNLTPEQAQARMASLPKQPVQQPVAPPELAGPPQQQFPPAPVAPATPAQTAENMVNGEPLNQASVNNPTEVAQEVQTKVRVSKAERLAKQAALEAAAPPGMRVVPENPRFNKAPGEKIGVGGYTYAHGAFGPETQARWEEQYGKRNVPYEQVRKDISSARMGPHPEGVNPEFKYNRPQYAPEYIKGGISPAMALNLAGNALGAAAITKQYQEGDKAGAGLNALMQIFGNIAPRAALGASLATHATEAGAPTLSQDIKNQMQAQMVGSGRGLINENTADRTSWENRKKYEEWLKKQGAIAPAR